jgi:hypothetical protein
LITIEGNTVEDSFIEFGVEVGIIEEINEAVVLDDFEAADDAVEYAKVCGGKVVQRRVYLGTWTPADL